VVELIINRGYNKIINLGRDNPCPNL